MILAWVIYLGDNREALVSNGGRSATSTQPYLWVYGGNHGDSQTLTNFQYLVGPNYALFAPYLHGVEIYKCPADRSLWPVSGKLVLELRSYCMNVYVGTRNPNVETPLSLNSTYRVYLRSSEIAQDLPAHRFVFIAGNPASICTPGFGVNMTADAFVHYLSTLHRGRRAVHSSQRSLTGQSGFDVDSRANDVEKMTHQIEVRGAKGI